MNKEKLNKILEQHKLYLQGEGGECADLRGCDLRECDLRGCDLRECNLSWSNLSGCDLSGWDLRGCDLSWSNLSGCDLRGCNLSGCDLRGCDLSGAKGLLDPSVWMKKNLEQTDKGYIAYKSFGSNYLPPAHWKRKKGVVLTEVVNQLPTLDCACGINVAIKTWRDLPGEGVWRVLIKWEWLPAVVVPYNTDGKFRCGKVKLLEKIN